MVEFDWQVWGAIAGIVSAAVGVASFTKRKKSNRSGRNTQTKGTGNTQVQAGDNSSISIVNAASTSSNRVPAELAKPDIHISQVGFGGPETFTAKNFGGKLSRVQILFPDNTPQSFAFIQEGGVIKFRLLIKERPLPPTISINIRGVDANGERVNQHHIGGLRADMMYEFKKL